MTSREGFWRNCTLYLEAFIDGRPYDCTDRRVHSGRVAAACQYLTEDSKVFLRGRASIGDDPVGKLVCEEVIPFSAIPNELWLQFEDQEFYERTVDSVMAVLRESEGKDRVVMYLKKEGKLRRLSPSWAIDAQGRLLEELYTLP